MTKLEFILDKTADANNRYVSANGSNYGVDWSKNVPATILEQIKGKSKEEAFEVLLPILDKRYIINNITEIIDKHNAWREINGEAIFQKMESIIGQPIPVEKLQAKITTIGRCPYNAKEWYFMCSPFRHGEIKKPEDSVAIAVHELLHMMLHHYYEEYIKAQGLTDEQFHALKEAQTVILNEEYKDLLVSPDKGYEIHEDIRTKFAEFRRTNKDFKAFVDYGIKVIKEQELIPLS